MAIVPDVQFYAKFSTLLTLFQIFVKISFARPADFPAVPFTCPKYQACLPTYLDKLNVHLVPHTHDDVGWLKTVDQYYYGHRNDIQAAGVQYILDSIIQYLPLDPSRRFIWVETAFLWQWWVEQNEETRKKVRSLVHSGQLEIIGGGWSMNDEATTYYQSTIDQFTWGFRILEELLGPCARPNIGWQIDPFGHARETASLMAQMGFDGLFLARLDYQDKKLRMNSQTAEFVWHTSANQIGESAKLFTHVLYNEYAPPPGFCFDQLCKDKDPPFIDDPTSPDYNVEEKVEAFLAFVTRQAANYRTNHVILTMGEDFFFQNAHVWYKNLDKLILHVNSRQSAVHVLYSTPSCYLKAVHDVNITWSTKQDDFFPYPSDENSYWTGYFTSRPTHKFFERLGNQALQVAKQLQALAGIEDMKEVELLRALRQTVATLQHHDAITGTEKQHVANDYALRLSGALDQVQPAVAGALNTLMVPGGSSGIPLTLKPCLLLNISQCDISENHDTFVVTIYNPLSHVTNTFVRLPVPRNNYKIFDPQGKEVHVQMVPIPEAVLKVPGRSSIATQEVVFQAPELPPLGFKTFYVKKVSEDSVNFVPPQTAKKNSIGNEKIQLHFDSITGQIEALSLVRNSRWVKSVLTQEFLFYEGFEGNNLEPKNRSSGAYIFRPRSSDTRIPDGHSRLNIYRGSLVEEVHQHFCDWITQVVRIYAGEDHAELEWLIGPIPVECVFTLLYNRNLNYLRDFYVWYHSDNIGKEVISRFSTDWTTNGVFFTDSNGREVLKRRRNFRPTWKVNISEPVSGNYYPVTSSLSIKQGDATLAVLPDRAQGGSSINDGQIELMLHRRLLKDDKFGVGEPLNEVAYGSGLVARGRHILLMGDGQEMPTLQARQRQLSLKHQILAPWILFAPTTLSWSQWRSRYKTERAGVCHQNIPEQVHLLTLEPWGDGGRLLVRLEHLFETNDDSQLSRSALVSLETIFPDLVVVAAEEMTLGGNQPLAEAIKLKWHTITSHGSNDDNSDDAPLGCVGSLENRFSVSLQPMQIRTYVLHVERRPLRDWYHWVDQHFGVSSRTCVSGQYFKY